VGGPVVLEIARSSSVGECDGLVPDSAPPFVTFAASGSAGATCVGGTGDGTGHVAVGLRQGDVVRWTVFSPGGARTGEASGRNLDELLRQPEGWLGVVSTPLFSPFEEAEHVRLRTDGSLETMTALTPPAGFLVSDVRIAADPSGGSGVAAAVTGTGGTHPSRTEAFRFDASGALLHGGSNVMSTTDPMVSFLGVGVSRRGETIVTFREPGFLVWSWLSRDGSLLATGNATQVAAGAADPVHLEPLLDGAVAARFDGVWSVVIPHLATTIAPAPAWLAATPGTALRFTRGNRGYAVLPPPGEALADCAQVVQLRAPSGTLCGQITIREGSGACAGGVIEQGWDGTLIRQSARDGCSGESCSCTVHAWPRLLAAP
jgi:hypothetical protein